MARANDNGQTFGEWLLAQKAECRMADLVNAAKADPKFPSRGSPDDIRTRRATVKSAVKRSTVSVSIEWPKR